MPYGSRAQQAFFNANRAEMENQGVDVNEYNSASKGMHLPARAKAHKKTDPKQQRKMMAQMLRAPMSS